MNAPAFGQCPPRYTVDVIPGPPCQFVPAGSSASALNENGEMIGGWFDCGGSGHPAVWLGKGGWVDLELPQGVSGMGVWDINSNRRIAGFIVSPEHPSLYRAATFDFNSGELVNLGVLPGDTSSTAHAINNTGVVCGLSTNPATGPLRAFVWRDGAMSAIDLPFGPYSEALGIADNGSTCGWMGDDPFTGSHAFISTSTGVIDLGIVLPGGLGSEANSVNNHNQACGVTPFQLGPLNYVRRGFLWSQGSAVDLGLLPGYSDCVPLDLNDDGLIVGGSSSNTLIERGFLWMQGTMYDLNDLVPPDLGITIGYCYSINEAGQIAANGRVDGEDVAMRLTPIPPLPADLTCDWRVNAADLLELIRNWGVCDQPTDPLELPPFAPDPCPADFTNDNRVGVPDLLYIINHWQP